MSAREFVLLSQKQARRQTHEKLKLSALSRSLRHRVNYNFVRLIDRRHKLANERARICAVIVKNCLAVMPRVGYICA